MLQILRSNLSPAETDVDIVHTSEVAVAAEVAQRLHRVHLCLPILPPHLRHPVVTAATAAAPAAPRSQGVTRLSSTITIPNTIIY